MTDVRKEFMDTKARTEGRENTMNLECFVRMINQMEDFGDGAYWRDKGARALADVFEKYRDKKIEDAEQECQTADERLYIAIRKNVEKNDEKNGRYSYLQAEGLTAEVDALYPYLDDKKVLNQKWHVLISMLAVLDVASYGETLKNEKELSNFRIGAIKKIHFTGKTLSIEHEEKINGRSRKTYRSKGMIEFIKKAVQDKRRE